MLSKNKLDFTPHFEPLTCGLQKCTALTHLDLRQNAVSDAGLDGLARVLMGHCPGLQHLDLGWNKFGSEAVREMAGLLSECSALTELRLDGNEIGGGADTLASLTQSLRALKSLVFDETELHPFQLIAHPSSSLQRLDLRYNDLEHAQVHVLQVFTQLRRIKCVLYSAALACSTKPGLTSLI